MFKLTPLLVLAGIFCLTSLQGDDNFCRKCNALREYHKNNPSKYEYYDEYSELQQIVDVIRVNAQERRKFMEKLYENVRKQEMILNNISEEQIIEVRNNKWSLWSLIEEKDMKNDLNTQKVIIDDIIEKENHLL